MGALRNKVSAALVETGQAPLPGAEPVDDPGYSAETLASAEPLPDNHDATTGDCSDGTECEQQPEPVKPPRKRRSDAGKSRKPAPVAAEGPGAVLAAAVKTAETLAQIDRDRHLAHERADEALLAVDKLDETRKELLASLTPAVLNALQAAGVET